MEKKKPRWPPLKYGTPVGPCERRLSARGKLRNEATTERQSDKQAEREARAQGGILNKLSGPRGEGKGEVTQYESILSSFSGLVGQLMRKAVALTFFGHMDIPVATPPPLHPFILHLPLLVSPDKQEAV